MKIKTYTIVWAVIFILAFLMVSDFQIFDNNESQTTLTPRDSKITGHAVNTATGSPAHQLTSSPVDYSTFVSDITNDEMIQSLPKDAVLNLKTYNFDSGTRTWEKSYMITRDSVTKGDTESDIQIIIHSKYIEELKSNDLCSTLSKAQTNGDFAADTEMSESSLIWKYKSMLKYRSCLGL